MDFHGFPTKEGYPNGFAQNIMRLRDERGHYYLQAFTWSRSYKDLSASTRAKPMFKEAVQESEAWFIQGSHTEENTNAIDR